MCSIGYLSSETEREGEGGSEKEREREGKREEERERGEEREEGERDPLYVCHLQFNLLTLGIH